MAYATGGSGATMTDLMDAIRAFAVGLGWTVNKWDSANRLLFMTKGSCAITMKGDTTRNVNVYYGVNSSGTFTSTPDWRLLASLNTSNTAALTTYHSHPGSNVTSDYDPDAVAINGLTGPLVAWYLFADPTVSDHIHVVVQINAECYMHFSFGHLDKGALTHNGVAYVTGCMQTYYRSNSNYQNGYGDSHNDPAGHDYPFLYGKTAVAPPGYSYNNAPPIILKNTNAWPAAWTQLASYSAQGNLYGTMLPLTSNSDTYRPDLYPRVVSGGGRLLDLLVIQEPTAYSNVVPLFPLPVLRYHYNSADQASRRACYIGDFPNVRACNMTNLTPGQEITVGSDTFKVFPTLRQSAWTDRLVVDAPQSGQFAIAYKKVP